LAATQAAAEAARAAKAAETSQAKERAKAEAAAAAAAEAARQAAAAAAASAAEEARQAAVREAEAAERAVKQEEQRSEAAVMEASYGSGMGESVQEEEEAMFLRQWFSRLDGNLYHRSLMCKGVEFGFQVCKRKKGEALMRGNIVRTGIPTLDSTEMPCVSLRPFPPCALPPPQYHNFYGAWDLSTDAPLCNGRPHYSHSTMYGGRAHLFHVIDGTYGVPRWVIGPSPKNEQGWAFAESDAQTPFEVRSLC
jgi:hypothetical protein